MEKTEILESTSDRVKYGKCKGQNETKDVFGCTQLRVCEEERSMKGKDCWNYRKVYPVDIFYKYWNFRNHGEIS